MSSNRTTLAPVTVSWSRPGFARDALNPGLATDARGAVLVMGIMFGAFMVGIIFHVLSVNEAILWRETTQDAADNAAFEAAAWNAHGMNLIAALNVLITSTMAVLTAWRTVFGFVSVVASLVQSPLCLPVCGAPPTASPLSFVCEYGASAGQAVADMQAKGEQLSERLAKTAKLLHDGQRVAAAAAPVVGLARSGQTTRESFPGVQWAAAVGPALIASQGASADCEGPECRIGAPVSLPVVSASPEEEEEYCSPIPTTRSWMLGRTASALGNSYDFLGAAVKGDSQWQELMSCVQGQVEQVVCGAEPVPSGEIAAGISGLPTQGPADYEQIGSEGEFAWAEMLDGAGNGNFYMQSYGLVRRPPANVEQFERLLSMPNAMGGDGRVVRVSRAGVVQAQAEMFVDCGGSWQACQLQALWRTTWRARLRRVRDPMTASADGDGQSPVQSMWAALTGPVVSQHVPEASEIVEYIRTRKGRLVAPEREGDSAGYAMRAAIAEEGKRRGIQNAATRVVHSLPEDGAPVLH